MKLITGGRPQAAEPRRQARFVVQGEPDRLDRVLVRALPELSRGTARRLITEGAVFHNGRRCRVASRLVAEGDSIRVTVGLPIAAAEVKILYADKAVVVVDKPSGMATAPTQERAAGTALDVAERLLTAKEGRRVRLHVVHRLDTPTSGALLFARGRRAAAALSQAFRDRRVEKTYLAVVTGVPTTAGGTIDLPLVVTTTGARVDPTGRPAITEWARLRSSPDRALLEIRPHTGRRHQIRAHLAAWGHPVMGDRRYGGSIAPRLLLHAWRLVFPHPQSGERLRVEATPPPAFAMPPA